MLTSLVEKSLVVFEEDGGRYRLLETVRQYARDRLMESGEGEAVRGQHRDYFLALAEEAEPQLTGPEQGLWFDRLEGEHDNLREALKYSVESRVDSRQEADDPSASSGQALPPSSFLLPPSREAGLRLSGALMRFWHVRGHFGEGRGWYGAVLKQAGAQERTQGRAKALHGAGNLAHSQGDYVSARSYHEQSLAILQEIGDRGGIAASLHNLGIVAHEQGDYVSARSYFEQSLAIKQEIGDRRGITESLEAFARLAAAQAKSAIRNPIRRVSQAKAGSQSAMGRAARLWGAAEARREAIGTPLPPNEREEYEREATAAREALGEAESAAAFAEGRAMTLEQAIEYALEGGEHESNE